VFLFESFGRDYKPRSRVQEMSQPEHVKDPSVGYLQVSTQMAMDNNPSSKRADVVFFALRLSYRLSDLIVRMGSFLQLIPDFHFPFELLS
jgi:hypothetical protein